MKTRKSTITDLPNDIRKIIPDAEQSDEIKEIIKQAEAGEFHDFKNKLYTCGKVQVSQMLYKTNDPRLMPIIEAVQNGVYDESPDAEDKALMKREWLESGSSLESYEAMFGKD